MTSGRSASIAATSDSGRVRSHCERAGVTIVPSGSSDRASSHPTWPFAPKSRSLRMTRVLRVGDAKGGLLAVAVVQREPFAVRAAPHVLDPRGVRKIPLDRLAQSGLESLGGTPLKLACDFARIDCVPAIVSRPILDERDQAFVAPSAVRPKVVEHAADAGDDEIGRASGRQ